VAVETLGLVDQAQLQLAMVEQTKVLAEELHLEIMQELEVLVL
jgi:hypothetical protein